MYPPFLLFNNETNTITLKPENEELSDRTFFFSIVAKEKNSDSMMVSYDA